MIHRKQLLARVQGNSPLCREHFRLVLRVEGFALSSPGQFIQISCRDPGMDYASESALEWGVPARMALRGPELLAPLALLRRPFSLAGRRDASDGVELDIIHRVVGVGTDWMSHLSYKKH
jgi:NAD(P)H-flavin reductase